MSATYRNFLERLREERLRLGLSQSETGQILRMSQSHYSKVELGTRRLTYYETQGLCETDMDVYYIFTGHRCETGRESFLSKCSYEELICYLNIMCAVLICLHENKKIMLPQDVQKKVENMQYAAMPCEKGKTKFYKFRKALNYNQLKMADLLEVDVKKLRGMECGKNMPDNEIIWRLSERFYVPYALILKDRKGLASEISYLLKLVEENVRREILNSMKFIHELFH